MIFGGYACMEAFVVRHSRPVFSHERTKDESQAKVELKRYEEACRTVDEALHALMTGADDDRNTILEAQCFMLYDPEFTSTISHLILDERYNAPHAVESAASMVIDRLSSNVEMFRENIADIQDIASRLVSVLTQESLADLRGLCRRSVIVADTILPSELLSLDPSLIGAICLDGGGPTSHVAILARAMDIPCVFALRDASRKVTGGSLVALDAFQAVLYVDPDEDTVSRIRKAMEHQRMQELEMEEDAVLPAMTRDGVHIHLECNIEGLDFVDGALKNGAEGVGLFRTEFLLMGDHEYDEDEQVGIYREVARRFARRGDVTIRTYDMGADKFVKGLGDEEANPALGLRAVRFCMSHEDMFRTQLRAILRASAEGGIRIMFPMISSVDELDEVLSFFNEVKLECRAQGLRFDEDMPVGTMIEVPSAAITSDLLAGRVDFFSVGTNDLTQYTVAVDRGNEKTAYLYKECHSAMLRLLDLTRRNADAAAIDLAICGEMAGNPDLIPLVVGLGYRRLSMNPASLLPARRLIRGMECRKAEELAKKALDMTSCRDVEALLEKFNAETRDNEQGRH